MATAEASPWKAGLLLREEETQSCPLSVGSMGVAPKDSGHRCMGAGGLGPLPFPSLLPQRTDTQMQRMIPVTQKAEAGGSQVGG